ncbi:hypothetical protein H8356DRAFT_1433819 [Neocallimastix lanati (nom. inval.)]|nr:hypothetical protein H8356DRAFT_1433819 [Neocallimastix sp. JGI-2020a]
MEILCLRLYLKDGTKCEKYDDILERYWKSVSKFQGIKGQNYDYNKFSNNKAIIMLSLKYPQFNLGFSWIIRLRCGYKYNTTIAIRMGRVSEDCPKSCPCRGEDKKSFEHWIFKCDALASFRWNSLNFIDDLYVLFLRKIRAFNPLSSYDSISNFEDYINHYIYLFLLGGTLVLNELHFDSGEQRQLNELLFKGSSESPVPKIVGLAEFLTSAIPIISSSFELLFDRYCKIPNLSKSVDVVPIRHNDNTGSSSISTMDESCPSSSINDESGESLVDTTLSILKMLLLGVVAVMEHLLTAQDAENSRIIFYKKLHSKFQPQKNLKKYLKKAISESDQKFREEFEKMDKKKKRLRRTDDDEDYLDSTRYIKNHETWKQSIKNLLDESIQELKCKLADTANNAYKNINELIVSDDDDCIVVNSYFKY